MAAQATLSVGAGFELVMLKNTPRQFRAHFHDYWLVGSLLGGSHQVRLRQEEFRLESDSLLVLNAGEPHACQGLAQGSVWRVLQIHKVFLQNLKLGGERLFQASHVTNSSLSRDFARIVELPQNGVFPDSAAHCLQKLLQNLAECSRSCKSPQKNAPAGFALPQAGNLPDFNPSLAELASGAGMEKYNFAHRFSSENGISPHRYLLNLRLIEARKLLSGGASLVEAAQRTGFYDQAHFSKTFKNCMGYTPGQYRSAVLS